MQRQIILDTETTGLSPDHGHRIIEIGCVELINRHMTKNHFHHYINPKRAIDQGAAKVHGITEDFLKDKPTFDQIAENLLAFLKDAELIIHNAPFDIGFLNAELKRINSALSPITQFCTVTDTLVIARREHPGQQNTLDALCKRYGVNNKHRDLHGALVDAALLSEVYLMMTGGQTQLFQEKNENIETHTTETHQKLQRNKKTLPVVFATEDELLAHDAFSKIINTIRSPVVHE